MWAIDLLSAFVSAGPEAVDVPDSGNLLRACAITATYPMWFGHPVALGLHSVIITVFYLVAIQTTNT